MKESSEKRVRTAISAAFAFLLFLSLVSMMLSVGAAAIFSESHLRHSLESSGYIEESYRELQCVLEEEADARGLPRELLSGQIEKKTFEKVLNDHIAEVSEKENNSNTIVSIQESAKKELTQYLNSKKVGKNEKMEEAIEIAAANTAGHFSNYTSFSFGDFFLKYKAAILSFAKVVIPVSILLSGILIFLLLRLHPDFREGVCYALSSFLATAFVSILLGFILRFGNRYERLDDFPAYSAFVDAFFKNPAIVFCINGFCMGFIALIGLIMLKYFEEKKQREVKG